MGFHCDRVATVDDLHELGVVMWDYEHYIRPAIELTANVPEFPFGALFGSSIRFLQQLGWKQIDMAHEVAHAHSDSDS